MGISSMYNMPGYVSLEYFFCWKILAVTSLELIFVYVCVHKRCICMLWNNLNDECALFHGVTSWILWRVCGVRTYGEVDQLDFI